jgi:ribosomal protein S27AE
MKSAMTFGRENKMCPNCGNRRLLWREDGIIYCEKCGYQLKVLD